MTTAYNVTTTAIIFQKIISDELYLVDDKLMNSVQQFKNLRIPRKEVALIMCIQQQTGPLYQIM
jgi:hypothetical protein